MAEQDKDWGARTIKRAAAWLERKMPTRDGMRKNRYLKPIAHRFLRSDLWRFTRRSVPRGVALGMLAAFLIPVGQIFAAVFLALPVRANVPIAALTTFITNPFTYPFWIAVANQIGKFVLRIDALTAGQPLNEGMRSGLGEWLSWFVREAGVTAFGFLLLAIVFGALGYVISSVGWRWWVARKRAKRLGQIHYGE
ncbi:hypothetical protein SAMN02745824_2813 [Parasphingorhabdus marina DSM 22363]|uniref:DUF2062 domain-containing protein n=1 Tax=Parasphingorhabdus marina DSM 22363 TaxID=1123272 RepID=A0A1N6GGA8_9SPHN|nr:hypothetical protein SAMN02745824_2813 [Parasphingorhabdus marina DSM 22363]